MKKPDVLKQLIREMRGRKAPAIDGSYVLLCRLPSAEYAKVAHPAYTPAQIEAERKAKGREIATHVYFIRDESLPAPYWLSPFRHAIRPLTIKNQAGEDVTVRIPHVVFDVARSRDSRKSDVVEVAIPVPVLRAKKQDGGEAYILEQLRGAIAALLFVGPAQAVA